MPLDPSPPPISIYFVLSPCSKLTFHPAHQKTEECSQSRVRGTLVQNIMGFIALKLCSIGFSLLGMESDNFDYEMIE